MASELTPVVALALLAALCVLNLRIWARRNDNTPVIALLGSIALFAAPYAAWTLYLFFIRNPYDRSQYGMAMVWFFAGIFGAVWTGCLCIFAFIGSFFYRTPKPPSGQGDAS